MKKIVLVLLSVFITSFLFAQDIIITKEGNKIESKILEINEYEIKYKNFANLNGPVYAIKKSGIVTIIYENGQVDVFNIDMSAAPARQITPNKIYTKADYESAKNLRNAGIGLFAGGVAAGFLGIFIGVAGAGNLNYSAMGVGSFLTWVSIPITISGIIIWPVGQTRMNRINRLNPNGFSLFENEKVQLNLAGNGLRLNF